MKNGDKCVLACWSGGLDSTAMVCDYLAKGYAVECLYGNLQNNPHKVVREKKATAAMFEAYFKYYTMQMVTGSSLSMADDREALMFQQPGFWLYNCIISLKPHHDEVAIGYVMNDDAISYLDEIRALWSAYQGLVAFPLPPLVFPMTKKKKVDLYYNVLNDVLKNMVTWCEGGQVEDRCGKCIPCLKMIDLKLMEPPIVKLDDLPYDAVVESKDTARVESVDTTKEPTDVS